MSQGFYISDIDDYAIEIAQNCALKLIKQPNLGDDESLSLAKALFALDLLPFACNGFTCEFGIAWNLDANTTRYISFYISENTLIVKEGVCDRDPELEYLIGKYDGTKSALSYLEKDFIWHLSLGANISVSGWYEPTSEEESTPESKSEPYKDKIIASVADMVCKKISTRIIRTLQSMKDCLLSGDDSPLKNTWDEICVQVQQQEFIFWDEYQDTAIQIIGEDVRKLPKSEQQAIWFQTQEAIDYEFSDSDKEPYFSIEAVSEYIWQDYILVAAGNWSNKRIEDYLQSEYQ